jgi:hypothetical protein
MWNCSEKAAQAITDSEPLAPLRNDLASQVPAQIAALRSRDVANATDVTPQVDGGS